MPELTIQPDASVGIDTYLDEASPTTVRGADADARVALTSSGDNKDAMFKFDLTPIAPGSTIEVATLSVYVYSETGGVGGMGTSYITRVLGGNSGWAEGGHWNKADGAALDWAGSVGCATVGVDIASGNLWSGDAYQAATPAWYNYTLDPVEFEALISNNYGFKFWSGIRAPGVNRSVIWRSSDYGTAAERPKLFIRWREPIGRSFAYLFNKYDPKKRIYDISGRELDPTEVFPNNWMHVAGFQLPSGDDFEDMNQDPSKVYLQGVEYDDDSDSLNITADVNQTARRIIDRLTRGA
jgi:hypothetical protein